MPDIRILPNEQCNHCGGKIGFFEETGIFKCLDCGKPYNTEEPTKTASAQRDYFRRPKGKAAQKRYRDEKQWRKTEDGKKSVEAYEKSVKGKLAKRKYYYSDKGQDAHQRRKDKVKLFKLIKKFLEANPGKTIEDYYKENPQ